MKKVISLLLTAVMLVGAMSITATAVDPNQWSSGAYCVVIADNVRFRWGPSIDYDIVSHVPALTYGSKVHQGDWEPVLGSDGNYWRVSNDGWICLNYVKTYQTLVLPFIVGEVYVAPNGLTVRQAPTTDAPSLGTLHNGDTVSVLAATHDGFWLMINYGNQEGWVHRAYLKAH